MMLRLTQMRSWVGNLTLNSRFYILIGGVLLAVIVAAYLRFGVASDSLYYIRLQQVYGMIGLVLLYGAILLTPLSKLVSKESITMKRLLFARRAVGVLAAFYILAHSVIALSFQFDGLSGIGLLPQRFQVAFLLGGVALLILLAMALTSFDKVITFMTFPRWKRLHRLVYLAGVLTIVHVWLIGSHADEGVYKVVGAGLIVLLFGLEALRISRHKTLDGKLSPIQRYVFASMVWIALSSSLLLLPLAGGNYHADHQATLSEVQQ